MYHIWSEINLNFVPNGLIFWNKFGIRQKKWNHNFKFCTKIFPNSIFCTRKWARLVQNLDWFWYKYSMQTIYWKYLNWFIYLLTSIMSNPCSETTMLMILSLLLLLSPPPLPPWCPKINALFMRESPAHTYLISSFRVAGRTYLSGRCSSLEQFTLYTDPKPAMTN